MWNWLERQEQRERDLERGVDADLVRDNRRRRKLALWSFGLLAMLVTLDRLFQLRGWWHELVFIAVMVCLISGFVALRWAAAESAFLHRPDPKEPPRLFKL